MKNNYLDIVTFIVNNLIKEDKFNISFEETKEKIRIDISVDKENIGKVIGKNGKVITSVRNLLSSIANKEKKNIEIKVIESK